MNKTEKCFFNIALSLSAFLCALTAFAYEDDYISVTLGDNGCVTRIDNGERIVYVFSNLVNTATVSSSITMKETMTLKESLVVGGGGAGGGFKGGGGGGGGVLYSDTGSFVSAGSEIGITVGAGGIGNANSLARKAAEQWRRIRLAKHSDACRHHHNGIRRRWRWRRPLSRTFPNHH